MEVPVEEFDAVMDAVAAGDLDGALKRLRAIGKSVGGNVVDRVVAQAGRLAHASSEATEGRATAEAYAAERMRIAKAVVALLREVESSRPAAVPAAVTAVGRRMEAGLEAGTPGEAINGINNLKSVAWLGTGLRVARSVCRVIVSSDDGNGYGTGFLIAPGRMMTNHHVIGAPEEARRAQVEFAYQLSPDGLAEQTARYHLDPDAFFHTSPEAELDYTVVAVRHAPDGPPLDDWGVLTLNADAVPVPRDLAPVVQHPNAQVKQVALTSSVVVEVKHPYLRYTTDTMPGSSGAPVFNDLWQVVAIHHRAGPSIGGVKTNQGVLMSAIRSHLGSHWPSKPT
jgi:V8-like Glu-specific endopeptidase